jgi:carbon-monoxide dehydrogenase large subunit
MSATALPHEDSVLTPEVAEALAAPEFRVEGQLKVTGAARYAADAHLPGMLWAAFLMSPLPHARIVSIDTAAAKALPGVHAVLTGADLGRARFGRRLMDWPVLVQDKVRFIGERVAAVAAESREQAEEALGLIQVEYDELPAVFEPEQALAEGAPILHENPSEYAFLGGKRPAMPHPNLQGYHLVTKGEADIERAFARAERVFEHTFHTARVHQGYIEPHATLVWIDADGFVHAISTNKSPFSLRAQLATSTGLPAEKIVVDSRFIGGDFGGKGLSIDEFACYFLARATGRPIKAVMSYVDELQAVNPRHAAMIRVRTGVTREGRFVAHQAEVIFNGGAYAAGKPSPLLIPPGGVATLAAYNVPNTRLEIKNAYTNTVPGGHMRAPGEVQALFAGESHVDMIAAELGLDPLQLRLLNAIREGDTGPANERFREPRAVELLETLRRETQWGQKPLPPNHGRGLALGVRHVGGGKTSLEFHLQPDGTVEVLTGVPDQGGGSHTLIRRVAAVVLSVDPERIVVKFGTTAEALEDPGAGGSRVTHIVGQAARAGATVLKERLESLAAEVMGWPAGRVRLQQDRFVVGDGLVETATFEEVARRIAAGGPVEVSGAYDGDHGHDEPGDFTFAAYMAEVAVDPETGKADVQQVVLAVDVGTVINPLAHQGQLEGGFIYGLGGALMEELPVEDGKVAALNLGEYKLPTQMDAPPLRTILLPTTQGPGPWGAKMAGEASNSGVAPAIANAIAAACGARVTTLPITAERILKALRG